VSGPCRVRVRVRVRVVEFSYIRLHGLRETFSGCNPVAPPGGKGEASPRPMGGRPKIM